MKVLRTPEQRFFSLPSYPFSPHYVEVTGSHETRLRMHYVDEGPRDGNAVVLLHGQPSWSYLYRNVIPVLTGAGFRVLAPDLIGFGRSDKPSEPLDYSYQQHVTWIAEWLDAVVSVPSTLVAHDWGGFLGLRVLSQRPERFERVVLSNTGLPDCRRITPLEVFHIWRNFVRSSAELAIGSIIQMGSNAHLDDAMVAAYDAPFPDESYKAGVRAFPELVPVDADHPEAIANDQAWRLLETWKKPLLTLFGDNDAINAGSDLVFQRLVPGAAGQPHRTLAAGHYLQEDVGPELGRLIAGFVRST